MKPTGARTLLLLAAIAGAAGGCRSAQTAPAPQPRKIKLVSSLPRSSAARPQTESIVNSIRLAIGQASGKVGDLVIDYQDWDDASAARGDWDPDLEAANARRAIGDPDVLFYLGTYNSGAAKISLPLLNRAGLVAISPANTYPGLTKPGACEPNEPGVYRPTGLTSYYRVVPTDDIQGRVAAEFARAQGWKTVYVLHDGGLYGQGIADIFTDTARDLGLSLLSAGPQKIDADAPEYRTLIRRIGELRPSVVYFGGTMQNNAGAIVRDLLQALPGESKLMAPDGCYQKTFIDAAGAKNLEGRVYVTFGGAPQSKLSSKGRKFIEDYRRAYQADPEGYGIFGYVAAQVALEALGKATRKDREGVRLAMAGLGQTDGVLGTWQFDADGDTSLTTMSINTVRAGQFAFVALGGSAR